MPSGSPVNKGDKEPIAAGPRLKKKKQHRPRRKIWKFIKKISEQGSAMFVDTGSDPPARWRLRPCTNLFDVTIALSRMAELGEKTTGSRQAAGR